MKFKKNSSFHKSFAAHISRNKCFFNKGVSFTFSYFKVQFLKKIFQVSFEKITCFARKEKITSPWISNGPSLKNLHDFAKTHY